MQPDHQAPHILVSNHAPEILALLRELLAEEGYRVTARPRSSLTLDTIVGLNPDLIVIDYMWPQSDNEWTLLNLLRIDRRTRSIPVILCTSAVRHVREMEEHLRSLGIRVVYKPFNIDELVGEVADALTGTGSQDARRTLPSG
jgi:CheY-like chemotaxis protein